MLKLVWWPPACKLPFTWLSIVIPMMVTNFVWSFPQCILVGSEIELSQYLRTFQPTFERNGSDIFVLCLSIWFQDSRRVESVHYRSLTRFKVTIQSVLGCLCSEDSFNISKLIIKTTHFLPCLGDPGVTSQNFRVKINHLNLIKDITHRPNHSADFEINRTSTHNHKHTKTISGLNNLWRQSNAHL